MLRWLKGCIAGLLLAHLAYADDNFLTISDIHYQAGGPVMNYGQGDTGDALWASTQKEVRQVIRTQSPTFIVLLGDLPAHDDSTRVMNLQTVLTDFSRHMDLPVFYVPGNNDALGNDRHDGNYHSFTNHVGDNLFSLDAGQGWPALHANQTCPDTPSSHACLVDPTNPAIQRFGYYVAKPLGTQAKLRLIVLNSVIWVNPNDGEAYVSDDGVSQQQATAQELHWLNTELAAAAKHGDRVLIALHVPPGLDAYSSQDMWQATTKNQFIKLVNRYQANIIAILSSHTHMDEIRRIHAENGSLIAIDVSTPGITPLHSNNPGIKRYDYNNDFALTDATTYYTTPLNSDAWHSYCMQDSYHCHTATLRACIAPLSFSDPKVHAIYQTHFSVLNPDFPTKLYPSMMQAIDVTTSH